MAEEEEKRALIFHCLGSKTSSHVVFEKVLQSKAFETKDVLEKMTTSRSTLLNRLWKSNAEMSYSDQWFVDMMSALQGYLKFIMPLAKSDTLRYTSLTFCWKNVINGKEITVADSRFELISILISAGMSLMMASTARIAQSTGWVGDSAMKETFMWLKTAAGIFDFTVNELSELDITLREGATDVNRLFCEALSLHCLGEAQELLIGRSILQGNKPALVAGLCRDNSEKFLRASELISQSEVETSISKKWHHYLSFKQNAYMAYAFTYHGLHLLKENDDCGGAINLSSLASENVASSLKSCRDFESAKPKIKGMEKPSEGIFARTLQVFVSQQAEKFERENSFIFHNKIPDDAPELCPSKSLVASESLEVASEGAWSEGALDGMKDSVVDVPTPADAVVSKTEASTNSSSGGCYCCRILVLAICMPLLFVISLVGILIWIVLLPLKIICCPIGMLAQLVANVVEWLIKAPLHAMKWAVSGKKPKKNEDVEKASSELSDMK